MYDDTGSTRTARHAGLADAGRRFRLRPWLSVVVLVCASTFALAQDFSGTYLGTTDAGQVTVELAQTGEDLLGSLSASGIQFAIEGFVQDGVGVGLAHTGEGAVGFEAYLEGDTLGLYLFEMDAAGAPIVESVIELIMTRQTAAPLGSLPRAGAAPSSPAQPASPGAPRKQLGAPAQAAGQPAGPAAGQPMGQDAALPAGQVADQVIATGAHGSLTQDNAVAFIEALEFVLAEIGYAYTFADAERAEALRAIATNYSTMPQMDQVVLSQARDIWQGVQANWRQSSQAEQREFALGVLILAFGEQTVSAWVGQGSGGGGGMGGSCTTFEDCTSSFVDEGTWTDTFNAQGCWAAAGCGGYDPSSNSFDYGDY